MTDDIITFIARAITGKDDRARPIYTETSSTVLCTAEPVSRSEYYSAGQIGIDPEALVIVNPAVYNGEKLADYHGRRMSVYRKYERSENELEIYLQLVIGQNGGTT